MCGINGIVGIEDQQKRVELINIMNKNLAHRGPDNDDVYVDHKVALGHRRLSIIDLSEAANQPFMSYDENYVIIYNGELYNYKALKDQLTEYPYKTEADTEVVLAAYIKWGKDCLRKFNGMFSFAIYDKSKSSLFVARDRLGIKPLYYFHSDDLLIFSSEIKPILKSKIVKKEIRNEALVDYFRYHTVHSPNTLFEGINILQAGHYMVYEDSRMELTCYWDLNSNIDYRCKSMSKEEIQLEIRNLLFESVESRMQADVPFGAFLSGGIDSSLVVGIMSQINPSLTSTFSVGFNEKKYDESRFAEEVAGLFGTKHHSIILKPNDLLDELPYALSAMDFPTGDGINSYIVSKATKKSGIKMALSGLGGDELFAGYPHYRYALKLKSVFKFTRVPKIFRKTLASLIHLNPKFRSKSHLKAFELLGQNSITLGSFYALFRQTMLDDKIKQILGADQLSENEVLSTINKYSTNDVERWLTDISIGDLSTYLQNTLLRDTDQMSMANSLEVRVPFMDHNLVEFVLGVNDSIKEPTSPKKLLTDSFSDILPQHITSRKKMGFAFPWEYWLKNDLRSFCESKIKALSDQSFINGQALVNHWKDFLDDNKSTNWDDIWYLVVLQNWLESVD